MLQRRGMPVSLGRAALTDARAKGAWLPLFSFTNGLV